MVLLTFTGSVNCANLQYRAERERVPVRFISAENAGDPGHYAPLLRRADLVVALPSGSGMAAEWFPSGRMLDAVLAQLRRSAELTLATRIPIEGSGRAYWIFGRRAPFEGLPVAGGQGLGPPRAPRAGGGPAMRWGEGPRTVIPIPDGPARTAVLALSCRADTFPSQEIAVRIDGREVERLRPAGGGWKDFTVRAAVGPGPHEVELAYRDWARAGRGEAVLYRRLQLNLEPHTGVAPEPPPAPRPGVSSS
jgi:hypothetical protein